MVEYIVENKKKKKKFYSGFCDGGFSFQEIVGIQRPKTQSLHEWTEILWAVARQLKQKNKIQSHPLLRD